MNENTTDTRTQTIENATRKDVCPGDHITWERTWEEGGARITVRREGIAATRNDNGDWYTEDRAWLTNGEGAGRGITITIRRTVQGLPTEPETVIDRADGHKYITATVAGETWRTREAILSWAENWNAVWRSGNRTRVDVRPEHITPGTWKADGQGTAGPHEGSSQ